MESQNWSLIGWEFNKVEQGHLQTDTVSHTHPSLIYEPITCGWVFYQVLLVWMRILSVLSESFERLKVFREQDDVSRRDLSVTFSSFVSVNRRTNMVAMTLKINTLYPCRLFLVNAFIQKNSGE